jgi:hypothetical protein
MNSSNPTFISIACYSFSGSTLLAMLLNAHPQIATVSEMHGPNPKLVNDIDAYRCSCGELIHECPFWDQVKAKMADQGFAFKTTDFQVAFGDHSLGGRLRYGSLRNNLLESIRDDVCRVLPGPKAEMDTLVARNEAFVRAVLDITGAQVFVDTTKRVRRFKYLYKYSGMDVRVVFLIRDARGSVASQMRHFEGMSASEAAHAWAKGISGIERIWKQIPLQKRMVLRYEDLCREPQATLQGLYRFFDIDPEFVLDELESLPPHHIVGNAARMRTVSQIRLDERWKRVLSPDQLDIVHQIAGSLNQSFGYT